MKQHFILIFTLFISQSGWTQSVVNRCELTDGSILFTQEPCSSNSKASLLKIAPNSAIQMASPNLTSRTHTLQVKGISREKTCKSTLSEQALRQALIRQQPRKGMSREQVISAFGKPERISTTQRGERFIYRHANDTRRILQFDEAGCLIR